ncbi:MAG: CHC2 zinc finger domain-containing protein [Methanofastidiosum sp.]
MIIPQELINEAKNKMGDKAATIIAKDLQLEQFDERNLKALCHWHREDTPSLVWNNKDNYFKCFGCEKKYDIIDHYMAINNLTFIEAVEKLFAETEINFKFGEKGVKTKREYRYPYYEENTNRSKVEKYLETRKISKETLDYCDIREDSQGNIVFNYYDSNDVLTTVKYRPGRKIKKSETKNWFQKNADTTPLLFNMNRINPSQPLLITEGELDCLAAIEAGYKNAVSVPFGAGNQTWIETNWDFLEQFNKIIIWSDADESGIKMKRSVIPRLGQWRCYEVDPPTSIEINGKIKHVKDINEVLFYFGKEKVLEVINSAKEMPITNVIDLSIVQDFDLEHAEGIYSGLPQFDRWIYKFFFGCLNVITGINSSGKSVLVNQICIAEALNQGYDVFCFSEELTKPQLKSWLEWNFTGRRHIKVENNHIRKINPEIKKKVREWYKGRIYVYDNDTDYSAVSILSKMEELARRKGVKIFVIDNLMMVDLNSNENNIWQKQKEFVIKLVNFANKFNVLVHLVAHPRKVEAIRRLTKLDIAGSGDITNLAHYVMGIHRVTPREKEGIKKSNGEYKVEPIRFDCIIDLFKNRITGTQDKEVGVYFDLPSYRFWIELDQLDKQYKWDNVKYTDKLPDPRDNPDFMK